MNKNQAFFVDDKEVFEKINFSAINNLYFDKEKKYLEVLYFQILRNSKAEKFDQRCLMYFLSCSEYLNSKIFQVLSKKNKEELKLNEFISGISLLFSKFLPRNGKILLETIFDLISDNSDSITYQLIKEFTNNTLFDCLCKAQIHQFEFLIIFSKNISQLIKKTFSINKKDQKLKKFSKNEFLIIMKKNPFLIKILIMMIYLLSPINEKITLKMSRQNNIVIFNNDDFEKEFEYEFEYDLTPRINSLPNENFLNFKSNPLLKNKAFKQQSSKCFNSKFTFGKNQINECINNLENKNQSVNVSLEPIEEYHSENKNFNKVFEDYGFFKNYYSQEHSNDKLSKKIISNNLNQYDLSTEMSNNLSSQMSDQNGSINCNSTFSKYIKPIDFEKSFFNSQNFVNKSFNKHSNCSQEEKNIQPQNIKELINLKDKGENKTENEYIFTSDDNHIFPSKDMGLFKKDETESELWSNTVSLFYEMKMAPQKKYKKFNILLRKAYSLNSENNKSQNKIINLLDFYNLESEDKIFPFKIKFIENDLVIYNTPSKYNSKSVRDPALIKTKLLEECVSQKLNFLEKDKYYLYFYNLKNILLPAIPEPEDCEFTFIFGDFKIKYFCLEFTHINSNNQLFFESYQQLVIFYQILFNILKRINRSFFLNTHKYCCNLDLLLEIDVITAKQIPFSIFHKLVDKNLGISMKVQTFDKSKLDSKNILFLKKLFDTCKFNNFLNLKILPIANFYESKNNIIIEFTDDDFRIQHDNNLRNYFIFIGNLKIKNNLIEEIGKFQKLIKLLNNRENITNLFDLINSQKTLVFNKG